MQGRKRLGHRSPKQSDAPSAPGVRPELSPAPSQAEADTEDARVAPIDPRVLNAICSEISSLQFEMAEDSDVKLDIEDLRNLNKLMHKSIEQVEDTLNAEFCCFEMMVMAAIEKLTSKVNSGEEPSHYNGFELEAIASKGKQKDRIQTALNVAMEDQDTNNPTQEELSGDIHVFPITKGKAPEFGQPITSSSKMQIDTTQAIAMAPVQNDMNPFVDKLLEVLAVHMGKISEKLDQLGSMPPSQRGELVDAELSAVSDDEPEIVEGPIPPDRQAVLRPHRFFASRAPSEASQEYRQCLEKDAEFVLNNHDFSDLTAEESNHLRELRHKLGNSFRFAQSNLPLGNPPRALRIVRGHRGGGGRDELSDDDGGPPPPPHADHRRHWAPLPPDDNPPQGLSSSSLSDSKQVHGVDS